MHGHRPLGKRSARNDPRTLRLETYLLHAAPPEAPPTVKRSKRTDGHWPMYMNDKIGCCTVASAAHMIEVWTASATTEVELTDADVLRGYKDVGKYNPANELSDQGANMLDVLRYWRRTGIGGRKIGAYVAVRPSNERFVRSAIFLSGGLYVGLDLPIAAQTQRVWDVGRGKDHVRGSWGGHAVSIVDYNRTTLTCVTWGELKKMTWAFFQNYCDEAYAVLSPDYLDGRMKTPEGFDLAALRADLKVFA